MPDIEEKVNKVVEEAPKKRGRRKKAEESVEVESKVRQESTDVDDSTKQDILSNETKVDADESKEVTADMHDTASKFPKKARIRFSSPVYSAKSTKSPVLGIAAGKCIIRGDAGQFLLASVSIPGKGGVKGYLDKSTCPICYNVD